MALPPVYKAMMLLALGIQTNSIPPAGHLRGCTLNNKDLLWRSTFWNDPLSQEENRQVHLAGPQRTLAVAEGLSWGLPTLQSCLKSWPWALGNKGQSSVISVPTLDSGQWRGGGGVTQSVWGVNSQPLPRLPPSTPPT